MISIKIKSQPNNITCGPTSLHAVYKYYKDQITLKSVINEVKYLKNGGTLAVLLGIHALSRGYNTTIYSYNLKLLDPTWFKLSNEEIITKLSAQLKYKNLPRHKEATSAYISYLKGGGRLLQSDLSTLLLKKYFKNDIPIIAGLSATYLYNEKREISSKNDKVVLDDIKGFPMGHFVVLCGFNKSRNYVFVADPYKKNPLSNNNYYSVNSQRLINSIMLGIVTYDANLLVIEPKEK